MMIKTTGSGGGEDSDKEREAGDGLVEKDKTRLFSQLI